MRDAHRGGEQSGVTPLRILIVELKGEQSVSRSQPWTPSKDMVRKSTNEVQAFDISH